MAVGQNQETFVDLTFYRSALPTALHHSGGQATWCEAPGFDPSPHGVGFSAKSSLPFWGRFRGFPMSHPSHLGPHSA